MISYKCRSCGGEMSVGLNGSLVCPYCGTKNNFSDSDLAEYREFRLNMLNYLRAAADKSSADSSDIFMWNYHDTVHFKGTSGQEITVEYLFYSEDDGIKMYVAKNAVIYIFSRHKAVEADKMLHNITLLRYPSADVKSLNKCFPEIKGDIALEGGERLISVNKTENEYPLFAFGNIRGEHTAWVVSRLENICCVLEYSGILHSGISVDSVFINPRTHEAMLLGGWWKARLKKPGESSDADLKAIRTTASKLLGGYIDSVPDEFKRFIRNKPADIAYDDFAIWDMVIEKGFGGHKFITFSAD